MSRNEEDRYGALAARAGAGEWGAMPSSPTTQDDTDFDELLSEIDELEPVASDEPTPAAPQVGVVSDTDVRELAAIAGRGRRSVGHSAPQGESPKRQVRLPADLDQLLEARVQAEHRNASEIMRDALAQYLKVS